MITRRHRFHGSGGLRAVYGRGTTLRAPALNLKYSWRQPGRPYRLAVVVSRKVNTSAVVRNRLRRRLYEAVRLNETLIPGSLDIVITVFSDQLLNRSPAELDRLIKSLLKKAAKTDQR